MGLYKYLNKFWQDQKTESKDLIRERLIQWRREPSIVVMEHPTRLDKARMLGYKAKQGFIVARIRLGAGGRFRPSVNKGRKPKRFGQNFSTTKNLQAIAELRVNRKYPNMEVLNSYYVAGDSKSQWYEVILIDRAHPAIINDRDINWIINQRGRAARGLTAAGKRSKEARRKESKFPAKRSSKDRSRAIKRRG
ncbi:MAG: 50S ribosomal protein L15e [Candidatus Nanoarchaeia archaeon]|nr:50S ribosomal protein L15e [Candidatus Nanoarchaeia archaeon]MDD5239710.1 50S ribosomal protein L15e [Candidatus Nanoarchaeia archaeon]